MNNFEKSLSSRLTKNVLTLKRAVTSEKDLNDIVNKNFKFNETHFEKNKRLDENFYLKPCIVFAKSLLGKILIRQLSTGEILKGRIVETECYLGVEDKASHSYMGRKTERNEAMFEKPGTAYVYIIYGMYNCFNISSVEEGSAVLIRAIEPLEGQTIMQQFRCAKRKSETILKAKDLCNGPSKLCQALNIEKKELNKIDLCRSKQLWLEHGSEINSCDIISCKRIGIDSAGKEWANKPLRFYIKDCAYVSVRNKQAEKIHVETFVVNHSIS